MTRKDLQALPYAPVTEEGERITARMIDGVLVVDGYIDKEPVGRYRMTESGYHECLRIRKQGSFGEMEDVKDPKWSEAGLLSIFGRMYWYELQQVKGQKTDEKVIMEFLGETCYKGARAIYEKETETKEGTGRWTERHRRLRTG